MMASDNKWYSSPIIYMLFLSSVGWLIGNINFNSHDSQQVIPKVVITDYYYKVVPEDTASFKAKPVPNNTEYDSLFDQQTLQTVGETPDSIMTEDEDSLFFSDLLMNTKIYQKPVKKTIIRYYKKKMDHDKVKSVEKYGFYIHERPSELIETHKSNALYLGDSISNRDILIVAYTLLKEGVEIKHITESKGHDDWKSHAIEVVTDTTVMNNPTISLRYLRDNWGDI